MTTNEELMAKVDALAERVATLEGVIAAGLSTRVRLGPNSLRPRHWTTVADPVTAAPVDPGSVYPEMFILPPQESPEAAEKMAAAARRILGAAFDAGAKGGGA